MEYYLDMKEWGGAGLVVYACEPSTLEAVRQEASKESKVCLSYKASIRPP